MARLSVVWDIHAKSTFKKHIKRIAEDSLQSAEQVRDDLLQLIDDLPYSPEKYPPDKFKRDNDGSFRAFEKHNLRVAYLITNHIRILRVRHVRQEPQTY